MVFSNYLLTISTNVVPQDDAEHDEVADWLVVQANNCFDDWARLNGTVLKPAGSPNQDRHTFPANHLIEGVRSRVTLEKGEQRGQVHMHVLMEIAHRYSNPNQWNLRGVHVNVSALRMYLTSQIPTMNIDPARRPYKIYVNCRLITRLNDTQAKWMTLQYIGKDTDKTGRDLLADARMFGTQEEHDIANGMHADIAAQFDPLNPGPAAAVNDDGGMEFGQDDAFNNPAETQADDNDTDADAELALPIRGARRQAVRRGPGTVRSDGTVRGPGASEDGTSSFDIDKGDRPVSALWTKSGRRTYKKKFG